MKVSSNRSIPPCILEYGGGRTGWLKQATASVNAVALFTCTVAAWQLEFFLGISLQPPPFIEHAEIQNSSPSSSHHCYVWQGFKYSALLTIYSTFRQSYHGTDSPDPCTVKCILQVSCNLSTTFTSNVTWLAGKCCQTMGMWHTYSQKQVPHRIYCKGLIYTVHSSPSLSPYC